MPFDRVALEKIVAGTLPYYCHIHDLEWRATDVERTNLAGLLASPDAPV
jgi:hypothetical protein